MFAYLTPIQKTAVFNSDKLKHNLAKKSFNSGLSTIMSQAIMFVINTSSTVILARILSPKDYGIIGMAMVVVSFAKMFMEAGLSTVTIQSKTIYHEQISTLFWANSFIGLLLALLMFSAAPFLAWFYKQKEVLPVTAILSATFAMSGIGVQHMAILRRHMRYGSLSFVYIVADIGMVVTTIILGLLGLKYWAIAYGQLSGSILRTAGMFYFCRWMPGKFYRGTGLRYALRFGKDVTVANFFLFLSKNIDGVLIGKFMGSSILGLYQKAYRLFMMPVNEIRGPLTNVSLSALSALKDTPDRYRRYFLRIIDLLTTAALPITLYCFIEADFIINLLLGKQWLGVIPVFRILALAGFIVPVADTMGIVLISLGESKMYMNMQMGSMIFTIIGVGIGAFFGMSGVAYGLVISTYIFFIPRLIYSFSKSPVTVSGFLKTLSMPVITTLSAGALSFIIKLTFFKSTVLGNYLFFILFWTLLALLSMLRKSVRETTAMVGEHVFGMFRVKGEPKRETQKMPVP